MGGVGGARHMSRSFVVWVVQATCHFALSVPLFSMSYDAKVC